MSELDDFQRTMLQNMAVSLATVRALVKKGIISQDDILEGLRNQQAGVKSPTMKEIIGEAMNAVATMAD